jgi:spore maturation protein CgeB
MESRPVIFERNEAVLRARAPGLAAHVAAAAVPAGYTLAWTPQGDPCLTVDGVPLCNAADPRADGVRWARAAMARLEAAGARRACVVGLGLAYHVEALAERFDGPIEVVEPDHATWRVALETRDLRALLGRVEVGDGTREARDAGCGRAAPRDRAAAARVRVLAHAPSLVRPGGAHRRTFERLLASAATSGLRLRVLVVSPLAGGSLPMASWAAASLRRLGHDAELLDLSPFHSSLRRLESFGARAPRRARLEAALCGLLGQGVAAAVEARAPDLVLALAQAPLDVAALEAIGRSGAIRALWFVEDFRRFTYWREVAAHYDHVFTIQTEPCFEALRQATDARLAYLPCAFEPSVHRPLELGEAERRSYGSDVSFVGAGYRNRRRALRRFLDLDFRIWGSDWEGATELERVVQRASARIAAEESVRVFNATRVNLNLHSSTYHDDVDPQGDFVNPRTFELAGSGAFQLVDRRSLLGELFAENREVAVAASVAEMREQTLYYLAHDDARRAIAAAGRARALAEHTYDDRMRALVTAVVAHDHDRLFGRERPATFGDVAARESGSLRRFLERYPAEQDFALDAIVRDVVEGEGALQEEEALFLFLHQFQELYLGEARA